MLKKILSQVKEYKVAALITPVFMILEVIMEMIVPKLMATLIDDGINAGNMAVILRIGGLMLVCAVFGLFSGLGGAKYGSKSATGFAANLREAMYEKIQTFSFENIDKFSTAGLVTRLTTDVTNVQNAFMMTLRMGMRAPFSMIIAMFMSISISKSLSVIYLVGVAFLVVVIVILVSFVSKFFMALFAKYDALNARTQENVSAIRVVKAYVREAFETAKFRMANEDLYRASIKAEKAMILMMPIMSGTIYTCILLISWFGAKQIVVTGDLTTGQLTSLLSYCMNILMNLMMLVMIFVMLTMSLAAGKRIAEVLDEEPTIKNGDNPVMEVADGSIEFNNVEFSYNQEGTGKVLQDVDLRINSGETIGIIGATGSAKSTLVSLIGRLYDVTAGSVKVGGVDVRDYDVETLRNQVSMVLQKNVLFRGTILDNLRWGDLNASDEECKKACELACAHEFISKMPDGYNTMIDQGGTNVSGGQRQRLCIARALLKKPKILILDDSTSAVDTTTDAKIRAAFRDVIPGTTKIIIAQRISSVEDADRVIVMDDGKINAFDTPANLLATNEIYKDVYESQTGAGSGDFDSKKED